MNHSHHNSKKKIQHFLFGPLSFEISYEIAPASFSFILLECYTLKLILTLTYPNPRNTSTMKLLYSIVVVDLCVYLCVNVCVCVHVFVCRVCRALN